MTTQPSPPRRPHDPTHLSNVVLMVREEDGSLGEVRLEPHILDVLVNDGATLLIDVLCSLLTLTTIPEPTAEVDFGYLQWGDDTVEAEATGAELVTAALLNAGIVAALRRALSAPAVAEV